jgi:hypothetical protein
LALLKLLVGDLVNWVLTKCESWTWLQVNIGSGYGE